MCIVSNVIDHYQPLIPDDFLRPRVVPQPAPYHSPFSIPVITSAEVAEVRALISEFKEALAAAKKLDVLMKQPDCVDPDKAKLIARVADLENRLDAMKPRRRRARKLSVSP